MTDYLCKICSICILGDGSVGKSSIIASFKDDGFTPVYKQTLGIDFFEKKLKIKDDLFISIKLWDVGGQSINSRNLDKYLSSSDILFLVYDVTNPQSFSNLDDWMSKIKQYSKSNLIYLIANKIDMVQARLIKDSDHNRFILENKLSGGLFVSAKTGDNLVKSFYQISAKFCGYSMTSYELSFFDKVVPAYITKSNNCDEDRTAWADEIEAEDLAAEKRRQGVFCRCNLS